MPKPRFFIVRNLDCPVCFENVSMEIVVKTTEESSEIVYSECLTNRCRAAPSHKPKLLEQAKRKLRR